MDGLLDVRDMLDASRKQEGVNDMHSDKASAVSSASAARHHYNEAQFLLRQL